MGGIARWLQFFFREPDAEALTVIGLQPKIAVRENSFQRLRINADLPAAAQMAAFGDKAIEFIGCVADFCLPAYQNSITSEVAKIAHDHFSLPMGWAANGHPTQVLWRVPPGRPGRPDVPR